MYRTFCQYPTFAKVFFCPFFKIVPQILPSVFFREGKIIKTHFRKHSNVFVLLLFVFRASICIQYSATPFLLFLDCFPPFWFYTYRAQAQSEHIVVYAYSTGYCLLLVVLVVLPLLQHAVVELTRT